MPYKSVAQRKWMHANLPALAKRWDKEYVSSARSKLPVRVKKKGR